MNSNAIFVVVIATMGALTLWMVNSMVYRARPANSSWREHQNRKQISLSVDLENMSVIRANVSYNATAATTVAGSISEIRQASANTSNITKHGIFYFAVTHSSNAELHLVNTSISTWCRRVKERTKAPVVWYSNKPQAGVDHVISYDVTDSIENITFRMAAVWKHVAANYPGYRWYARFWDDNYVVVEHFEEISEDYDHRTAIEIGRLADYATNELVRVGEENSSSAFLYVDGGAGSLLSHEAMLRLTGGMDRCLSEIDPSTFPCAWRCEDVLFGHCMRMLFGVSFRRALGMYHGGTDIMINRFADQLRAHEPFDGEDRGEASVMRTMHWVSPGEMKSLDALIYGANQPVP